MEDIDLKIEISRSSKEYWDSYDKIIELIDTDEAINKEFKDIKERMYTPYMVSTIYDNDKLIGFANLIIEKQNPNFLFLDMGIIDGYRGKHVASKILEELKVMQQFIIVETKKDNFLANKSLENRTEKLFEINNRNVYLLQKDRFDEFKENGYIELLKKHYGGPSNRMAMLDEIYKEEEKKGKIKQKTDKENR